MKNTKLLTIVFILCILGGLFIGVPIQMENAQGYPSGYWFFNALYQFQVGSFFLGVMIILIYLHIFLTIFLLNFVLSQKK
jgi:ABC-type uncharacterized transport system fused permease/ATPase subunit